MGVKRKRDRSSRRNILEKCKRPRLRVVEEHVRGQSTHATLCLYYKQILTLREYLLSQLPKSSKKRRRRIASVGRNLEETPTASKIPSVNSKLDEADYAEPPFHDGGDDSLTHLLDQTLVCSIDGSLAQNRAYKPKDLEAFSQQISLTAGSSVGESASTQSELIDFAIWLLFHRVHRQIFRPPHMLCHGYQRVRSPQQASDELCPLAGIPGIVSHYPNGNVSSLKSAVWDDVLQLLGKEGEQVMLGMIIHCGIFVRVENGRDNLYQLSGTPMTDLRVLKPVESISKITQPLIAENGEIPEAGTKFPQGSRTPASICFVRNRMFYARAALNTRGKVTFGLRHIHALNRYSDPKNKDHALHLLQYIFPREFGLHNVFTSPVDPKETVQPFKDYTMREAEFACKKSSVNSLQLTGSKIFGQRIPRRLRGGPMQLVQKLQVLHSKCSYYELLKYYCPLEPSKVMSVQSAYDKAYKLNAAESVLQRPSDAQLSPSTTSQPTSTRSNLSLFDLATPQANVSAFCRAAISKLIPDEFWGADELGRQNKENLMHKTDRFVKLRRFDPMSLHEVSEGLKVRAAKYTT